MRISDLDEELGQLLSRIGLRHLWQLAEEAATPRDRRRLAGALGVGEGRLLRLVMVADMCRVAEPGLAKLLVEAGVYSPSELEYRRPAHVHAMVSRLAGRLGVEAPQLGEVEEACRAARGITPLFVY